MPVPDRAGREPVPLGERDAVGVMGAAPVLATHLAGPAGRARHTATSFYRRTGFAPHLGHGGYTTHLPTPTDSTYRVSESHASPCNCRRSYHRLRFKARGLMTETDASLGARISRLRERRGWTQKQLAEKARISVTFLSEVENDKPKSVGGEVLLRLAAALGASLDFLMTGAKASTQSEETISIPSELTAAAEERGWSYKDTVALLHGQQAVVARRTRTGEAVSTKTLSKADWISLHRAIIEHD
jgi:transcriptional regulator with XRE-family HTH domain